MPDALTDAQIRTSLVNGLRPTRVTLYDYDRPGRPGLGTAACGPDPADGRLPSGGPGVAHQILAKPLRNLVLLLSSYCPEYTKAGW
jgi:hypothetical protein